MQPQALVWVRIKNLEFVSLESYKDKKKRLWQKKKNVFEETIAEKLPNVVKEIILQVQKANEYSKRQIQISPQYKLHN